MERSEQINELTKALVKAQAEVSHAIKDRENPHFRNRYADLGSVVDACKPALNRHGLSFAQLPEIAPEGLLLLTTILMHESGQWISSTGSMPLSKADPQGYGSALTYARRYFLAALVGVVADDDDDGNGAAGRGAAPAQSRPASKPAPAPTPKPAPARQDAMVGPVSQAANDPLPLDHPRRRQLADLTKLAIEQEVLQGGKADTWRAKASDPKLTEGDVQKAEAWLASQGVS